MVNKKKQKQDNNWSSRNERLRPLNAICEMLLVLVKVLANVFNERIAFTSETIHQRTIHSQDTYPLHSQKNKKYCSWLAFLVKVFSIVIVLVVVVVSFSRTQQSPFHCCLYRSSYPPLDSRVFKETFPCIYCLSCCCPCSCVVYISLLLLLSSTSSPFHCVALSYERSFRWNAIKYDFVF